MPSICAFKCCKNRGGHFFPKDPVLVEKWLTAIGRPGFVPSKHSRVCSAHFRQSDFVTEGYYTGLPLLRKCLKKDAVPTVFHTKEPLGESGLCANKPEAVKVNSSKPAKRKRVEPVTNLRSKSSKVMLLIKDPHYGKSTKGVEEASDANYKVDAKIEPKNPLDLYSSPECDEQSYNNTEIEPSVDCHRFQIISKLFTFGYENRTQRPNWSIFQPRI